MLHQSLSHHQVQRQEQRLAPQIIQSIEILQLPALDLVGLIKQELEENPVLEMAEPGRLEQTSLDDGPAGDNDDGVARDERQADKSEGFDTLEEYVHSDERWRESLTDGPPPKRDTLASDRKHEALQNTAARAASLQDHLFEQFRMLDLTEIQRKIGEQIIYNIDDNGYLRYRVENIIDDMLCRESGMASAAKVEATASAASEHDVPSGGGDGASASASAVTGIPIGQRIVPSVLQPPSEESDYDHDLAALRNGRHPDSEASENGAATEEPEAESREKSSGRTRRRRRAEAEANAPSAELIPLAEPPLIARRHPDEETYLALLDEAEETLAIIRTLDPPGVGAYSLKECLLLQLTPDMPHALLVSELVEHHLDDIMKNRLPAIGRATGHGVDEIKEALATLALLSPRPGATLAPNETSYIVPDVIVHEVDGEYIVTVEDQYIPRLAVSQTYIDYAADRKLDDTTRDFVRKNIESARWLQDAIEQRRYTLQRVAQEIVNHQKRFFDEGLVGLRPLKMQEIADRVDVHVSTVSRAVSEKYIETPRGIFPIKYFFRGGAQTTTGEEESTELVKERVKKLVEEEDPAHPLSDEAIATRLSEESGVEIARRTVTKYRKALGIPSSRQRREY